MKYVRKPEIVDAMQWLAPVHNEVMSWAAGKAYFDPFSNTLEINVNGKIKRALSGDYLVKDTGGVVDTVPQSQFEAAFERYVEVPGNDGDSTGLPADSTPDTENAS